MIDSLVRKAATQVEALDASFEPEIRPTEPRFGDFQSNGVLPFAKKKKTNPRALATELVAAIEALEEFDADLVEIQIAGPGFINFRFTPKLLQTWLNTFKTEHHIRQGAISTNSGRKIVIDYPSPNTAKQMHIGHLRPMVIGEAIKRLLSFSGAELTADNHIGDWGTNFGTLIMAIKKTGFELNADAPDALEAIENLYKQGNTWEKEDPSVRDDSRNELVKLQDNDPENTALWEKIIEISNKACEGIYEKLGITIDITLGESFYRDKVDRIYTELTETNLAETSEGALVVFHPEHPRFKSQPFIIRKKDGASNYGTTDLATLIYRLEHFQAEEIVYVTDGRQQDHFQQLFLTAEKWFAAKDYALPKLSHVWFGTILGEDGKAIKTKSGTSIKLDELLQEAEDRALQIVKTKNPNLSEAEHKNVARVVGLSAVKYADLSSNRTMDYVFAWDKLLAFEGNTAPYLLYAVARIHSIFRKAGISPDDDSLIATASSIETEQEIALAQKIITFPSALNQALGELRPHHLCTYLYELAGQFSTFYNAEKVNIEDTAIQARRLILCARTMRILETGLHILGIETLERM